jgi:hypothetical protein
MAVSWLESLPVANGRRFEGEYSININFSVYLEVTVKHIFSF